MAYLCIYNNSECDGCGKCEQEEVEVDIDYEIEVALERAERKNQEYIDRA